MQTLINNAGSQLQPEGHWSETSPHKHTGAANGDPIEVEVVTVREPSLARMRNLSGHYTPIEWARIAVAAYKGHGADRVVAETNNGGEMVDATLRVVDDNIAYSAVHATRGKIVRAEPVAALYEQGRIKHMAALPTLEDQMCEFLLQRGVGCELD